MFYLTGGLLSFVCGSSHLGLELLVLLLQSLEIDLQLPPPAESRLELDTHQEVCECMWVRLEVKQKQRHCVIPGC